MAKILDDCFYDKIKILHDMSCMLWFIEKHAEDNAKKAGDEECHELLDRIEKDLEKHITELKKMVCQTCK